jgi:protein-histidine pros-kinase
MVKEGRRGGARGGASGAASNVATSEAVFRELVEAGPDALLVVDARGEIVLVNREAERMFGRSRADLVGQPASMLVPERMRGAQRWYVPDVGAPTSSRPSAGDHLFGLHRDGGEFPIEVNLSPLEMVGGTLVATSIRDVSDRRKVEDEIRGLLDSAPDALVVLGRDGVIKRVNRQTETLFGYDRAELVGQAVEVLVPERFRQNHVGHRIGYLRAPRPRAMGAGLELFAVRKDGKEFPAEISLSPTPTVDGIFVTAAIRDVTEQKQRAADELRRASLELERENQRMQEANRLKSEFLANMSHELRTPLNAIIGFASLLHAGKAGALGETQVEYLGDILTSSRHLLQLINDVLDLAKVESGKVEITPQPVDLSKAAAEVRDIVRGLAGERRVRLDLDIDPRLGVVKIDPRLLKQVLYNYVSNAIKFTPEGGHVSIRMSPVEAGGFRVDVVDTGIGIKAEDIPRLFVEFQQLDSGLNKKYQGTGLGLALTKRIVQALEGQVEVQSTPGEGTTFSAIFGTGHPAGPKGGAA